ncbi:MAG: O-antigen ligase family protein [bacterium]|nr:O-antigen ligase family protein [bacterium]
MAILRQWYAHEPAAWYELALHLRWAPFLDESNRYVPLRYLWQWSLALATYLALLPLVRRPGDVRVVLWSIALAALPAAALAIYSYLARTLMVSHYAMERRVSATFSTPAVLADMLTVACVAAAYLLFTTRRAILWVVLSLSIVGSVLAILFSGCRLNLPLVTVALLLIPATLLALRWPWFSRHWWVPVASAPLLAGLLIAAALFSPPSWQRYLNHIPAFQRIHVLYTQWRNAPGSSWQRFRAIFPGRISHWQAAANMFRRHPLWGTGAGLFESSYARYRARDDLFVYARAHNVFLRIAAEGGLVTLLAFLAIIVSTAHSLAYHRGNGLPADAPWLRLRSIFLILFPTILISSSFSDIWFENTESNMMLSLLAAAAMTTCRALAPVPPSPEEIEWLAHVSWWHRFRVAAHALLLLLTWGWLGLISFRRAALFLLTFAFCLLGLRRAFYDGRKTMLRGEASHGFIYASRLINEQGDWYAFGRAAMWSAIVPADVMCITFRPLNDRMGRAAPHVNVFVNNVHVGRLAIYPNARPTLYCDLSRLRNDVVVIRLVAERTFSPWRLGWYKDPFPYGGICSAIQWISDDPFVTFTSARGFWNAYWTARVNTYFALGHTNYDATVPIPFFVHTRP